MSEKFLYNVQCQPTALSITVYAHDLFNYRYHCHNSEYEIDIIFQGKAEFCNGTELYQLEEDDVILINPSVFHGSFVLKENSKSLVFRFSEKALRSFLYKFERINFSILPSNRNTRKEAIYAKIRYYCAIILSSLGQESEFQQMTISAAAEMLLSTLCESRKFTISKASEYTEYNQDVIQQLLNYINDNYFHKISLDDLARHIRYNRTYVSTLFKNVLGINFHNYLMKIRLSHAMFELGATEKSISQIALDCGFTDFKSFNRTFREVFHCRPMEYRQRLEPERTIHAYLHQIYVSPQEDPVVSKKLNEYMNIL